MAKVKGAITVNIERCKGCNLCAVACPTNTLALQPNEVNDRGYHYAYMANPDNCTGCCSCAWVCPDACIEVYRVKVDLTGSAFTAKTKFSNPNSNTTINMKEEVRLIKGNEAIAHAAIRFGFDGYFGYPITPQSEVLETLEELMPWETTGMVVLQA